MLEAAPESIDAVRFERLARDGRDALLRDPKQVVDTLRAALALWRGEPLAEFGFELFAQAEITRLTELRIAVLENCVEAKLALGRHAVLCAELTLAVTEHPLRERLWSQLIRALYRCGRQAEALGAYARLREQLAELLGIDPSPELVRLHEAVLASVPMDWSPPQPQAVRIPSGPVAMPTADQLLPEAHAALAAHDWQRAFDLLSGANRAAPLSAETLDGLAEAAYWLGRYREALPARQRAHHAYLQAGNHRRAAVAAVILAIQHAGLLQFAVPSGWFQRAQRLLEAEPDCAEHGYLSWGATLVALRMDDQEKCLVAARSTYEMGVRHGIPELQTLGMVFQGGVLIRRGQLREGLALHDEGMAMAVGGVRIGDLASAEEAFVKAEELGASPLPGLARLELLRDRPAEAAALINAALVGRGWDRLDRARLVPDQVAIALAVGDFDTARGAAAELAESAQTFGSKALLAAAEAASGALALATGEGDPLPSLRRGVELWHEARSPYESARVRMALGTASDQAGQPEAARLELAAARGCIDRLGARLDAEAAAAELLIMTGERVRS